MTEPGDGWRRRWRGRHGWTAPPPDPPGAESAERIFVGYRTWLVGGEPLRLFSVQGAAKWPPGEPMIARGNSWRPGGAGIYAHSCLGSNLNYGAFRSERESRMTVIGKVALWGNIRSNCGEWMADQGYPLSLDVAPRLGAREIDELRRIYGLDEREAWSKGQ